jgi:ABC-type uncharacterized transport system involved in gliding motility auxiliary subunit
VEDDPSTGEALISLLFTGLTGLAIGAAYVLPVLGLGIWLTHVWRRRRAKRSG